MKEKSYSIPIGKGGFPASHVGLLEGNLYSILHPQKTSSSPLNTDGWKMTFLVGRPPHSCYVSFREAIIFTLQQMEQNMIHPRML